MIENALQVFYAPRMHIYDLAINLPYAQYEKKMGVNNYTTITKYPGYFMIEEEKSSNL